MVLFTATLAVFTWLLAKRTHDLWKAGEKQIAVALKAAEAAELSANAAKTSADAYQVSERAWVSWIRVEPNDFESTDVTTGERMVGTMFQIRWVNGGRTPAIKCSVHSQGLLIPAQQENIPMFTPPSDYVQRQAPLIHGVTVTSRACYFTQTEIEALRERQCRIFIYGLMSYEDIFSKQSSRHTEVCFEVIVQGLGMTERRSSILST